MITTLNKIRKHNPCTNGWEKLLKYLGKTKADDEEISVLTILDSNGLDDALWCLRSVEGYDREIRLYAVWCARQVQHLMKDPRSVAALDVAEKYALGEATEAELTAAEAAARAAARSACDAARVARVAAWDAARAAARVARVAAWDAARAAAWVAREAAGEAAWAARDEMRQRQESELRRICEEG